MLNRVKVLILLPLLLASSMLMAAGYPDKAGSMMMAQAMAPHYQYDCNWAYDIQLQRSLYPLQKHHITYVLEPYAIRFIIPTYVLFKTSQPVLRPEAGIPLKRIAEIIKRYPGANIKIYSYVDDTMRPDDARKLTNQRAQQVAGYFWLQHIPDQTQTLKYAGKGSSFPIADSETISGISDNRRIEIIMNLPRALEN